MDKKYIRIAIQQANAYQRRRNYEAETEPFNELTERLYKHMARDTDFELTASERQGLIEATKKSIEYELGPDAHLLHPKIRRKVSGKYEEFLEALEAGE